MDKKTGETINYHGYLYLYKKPTLDLANRDMLYKLYRYKPLIIFRTLVGRNGYDFRVGSRWDDKIGDHTDHVKCIESTKYSDHKYEAFRTQLRSKTRVNQRAFSSIAMDRLREPEFLTYEKVEIQECNSEDNKIKFLRVKNVIDFATDIQVHEIETYDSVRISYKYVYDFLGGKYKQKKHVRIVEIKYLEPKKPFTVLKYTGTLEMENPAHFEDDSFDYELTKTVDDIVQIVGQHHVRDESLSHTFNLSQWWDQDISINGSSNIMLGSTPQTTLGSATDIAECFENKEAEMPDTLVTLTDLSGGNEHVLSGPQATKLIEYNNFITFESKISWNCTVKVQDKEFTFQKGVIDGLISREKAVESKSVRYPDNVQLRFVASIDKAGKSEHKIKFRDTFYWQNEGQNTPNLIQYPGLSVIKGEENGKFDSDQWWKCGTQPIPNKDPIQGEVTYERQNNILDKPFLYRTQISKTGVTLQLGSQWNRILESRPGKIRCMRSAMNYKNNFDEYYKTYLLTKVRVHNDEVTIKDVKLFDEYFESIKKEVWSCKAGSKLFRRVLNHFTTKPKHCNDIKDILHPEGFTFLVGQYTFRTTGCMEIVEIKYVEQNSDRIFRYDGELQLEDENGDDDVNYKFSIKAERLKNVAKKDTFYSLHKAPEPYVLKTFVSPQGYILEVDDTKPEVLPLNNLQANFRCARMTATEIDLLNMTTSDPFSISYELKENKMKVVSLPLSSCFKQKNSSLGMQGRR
ncbi:uncharacterized protein LOC111058448 isoform X2 [Nilaparvata lugens]|uniref:uncharacterized protein LOC111058448 isoform X2 n=1 Tax=Nilaparvata lugens TaxID=108931 RepID=UPI00193DBA3C|nr:uncharacterized protein LOC111058448 isoform X2 [Nilaparvata lugens]